MRVRTLLIAALVAAVGVASAPDAEATSFRQMTFEQRVDMADVIVRGTVDEVWTERDDVGRIWTRAQLSVEQTYKGEARDALIVDQLGGTYAGMRMPMDGAARFSEGEEIVVILDKIGGDRLSPIGMVHGKFTIMLDPYTHAHIIHQFHVPLHKAYDHRFIPLPAEGNRLPLVDFEDRIERALLGEPNPNAEVTPRRHTHAEKEVIQ